MNLLLTCCKIFAYNSPIKCNSVVILPGEKRVPLVRLFIQLSPFPASYRIVDTIMRPHSCTDACDLHFPVMLGKKENKD